MNRRKKANFALDDGFRHTARHNSTIEWKLERVSELLLVGSLEGEEADEQLKDFLIDAHNYDLDMLKESLSNVQ